MMNALSLCFTMALSSAPGPGIEVLFTHRARVEVASGTEPWVRLPIPVEVLEHTSPDGRNLRLIDGEGRGIAFEWLRRTDVTHERQVLPPAGIVAVERTRPAEAGLPWVERYRLIVPPLRPALTWKLALSTPRRDFVCSVDLVSSPPVKSRPAHSLASVFRLSRQNLEKLSLDLPPLVENVLEATFVCDDTFLEPSFQFEAYASLAQTATFAVQAPATVTDSGEVTEATFALRAGLAARAIRLHTSSPFFERSVVVTAAHEAEPLGQGWVFRAPGSKAENRDIPIRAPVIDREVTVSIPSADGVQLRDLRIEIIGEESVIFFAAEDAQDAPLWLYFGGDDSSAPRKTTSINHEWKAARVARVMGAEENPLHQPIDPLGSMFKTGAALDDSTYTHEAILQQPCAGVCEVRVTPAVAALLERDLRDLRFVDERSRQVPYVLDEVTELHEAVLPLARTRDGISSYDLKFEGPVLVDSFALKPRSGASFQRHARLVAVDATGAEIVLGAGSVWNNVTRQGSPSRLTIPMRAQRVRSITLTLDDGSEAALPQVEVVFQVRVPVARVVTREVSVSARLGNPQADLPRYDVASMREFVLAMHAEPASLGPVRPNPRYRAVSRLVKSDTPMQLAVWATLGAAMAVLGFLTIRLVRQQP